MHQANNGDSRFECSPHNYVVLALTLGIAGIAVLLYVRPSK
jgi:hypothetical protein